MIYLIKWEICPFAKNFIFGGTMYRIHVVICRGEENSFLDCKKELLFFSPLYQHTFRKFEDAAFNLKLDCQIYHAAAFDLDGLSQDVDADVDDIIIFTTPLAFWVPTAEVEKALTYVMESDLGYATLGSMRNLYATIGSGKMLTDNLTLNSPYDFIQSIGLCGAKCEQKGFCENERGVCESYDIYLDRVEKYKREYFTNLRRRGIKIENPDSVVISPDTQIGRDTVILPNTQICAGAKIGTHCVIGPSSVVSGGFIGNDSVINASQVYGSAIEDEANIGPYCHIEATQALHGITVKGYCEVVRSEIGAFTEINTHSMLANCKTGPRVKIGSHVTCANFDGRKDNSVKISDDAFIGAGSTLVAPLNIGQGAFIAAGSTITDNVPAGALGIAREYQSNHEGWARRKNKS
jgi:acetyltransferase-like isoleucine patch superfamily enzyme